MSPSSLGLSLSYASMQDKWFSSWYSDVVSTHNQEIAAQSRHTIIAGLKRLKDEVAKHQGTKVLMQLAGLNSFSLVLTTLDFRQFNLTYNNTNRNYVLKIYARSPDKIMSAYLPLQLGAPINVSDGAGKDIALYSDNQDHGAEVRRVYQDRCDLVEAVKMLLSQTQHQRGFFTRESGITLTASAYIRTLTAISLASGASFSSLIKAVEGFNHNLTQDRRDLLIDKQTKFSVLIETAQQALEERLSAKMPKHTKTQIWRNIKSGLEKFCQVVYHYSAVMDVLVSAHPEIAALAWGAIKFLLAVSVNHQELKEKILYHLVEIGEQFKIVENYVKIFPEADMVEQVCGVYDNFTGFLQLSIDWCKENAIVKFFKNVALPYEARIKPTIDELNRHMKKIKERVDVHNAHRLAGIGYDISAIIGFLDENKRLQVDLHAVVAQLLRGIASDQKKGLERPIESTTSTSYKPINDSLSKRNLATEEFPTTSMQGAPNRQLMQENLKDCIAQSVQLEAGSSYLALDLPNKPEVKAWLRSDGPALLWIDGFANSRTSKWTTEFSVDVLLGTERQSGTVLFYFSDIATNDVIGSSSSYLASPKAIIHTFIVQLLRQHAYLVEKEAPWLTPQRWIEARHSTKAAWNLLHHLLQSLSARGSVVYLIIDSIDALTAVNSPTYNLQTFLRRLSALVTSSPSIKSAGSNSFPAVKILLTSVTGSVHPLLFSPNMAESRRSHVIVHIPQTFGQHNVASAPAHLRKARAKRLVRLPDSDDEFGLKPADSFDFSDDEEGEVLTFSSDEELKESRDTSRNRKETRPEISEQNKLAQNQSRKVNRMTPSNDSSEDLDFSENETDKPLNGKRHNDDLQFSSSSEEET